MNLARVGRVNRLRPAGGPADFDALDARAAPKAEVERALARRAEAAAARDLLHLLLAVPVDAHLRAQRAAVALGALKLEPDPSVLRRDRVLINEERPALVRDHHVEHAAVPQVGRHD